MTTWLRVFLFEMFGFIDVCFPIFFRKKSDVFFPCKLRNICLKTFNGKRSQDITKKISSSSSSSSCWLVLMPETVDMGIFSHVKNKVFIYPMWCRISENQQYVLHPGSLTHPKWWFVKGVYICRHVYIVTNPPSGIPPKWFFRAKGFSSSSENLLWNIPGLEIIVIYWDIYI